MQIKEVFKTTDSRRNFLTGLIRISKCDGKIDESEKFFFSNSSIALGLNQEDIDLLNSYWDKENIEVNFNSKKESLCFFQQAIQLCHLDGRYSDKEKNEIQKLSETLNISKDSITKIENWVEEGIKWAKDGDNLLYLE